jgi:hypothetical protein
MSPPHYLSRFYNLLAAPIVENILVTASRDLPHAPMYHRGRLNGAPAHGPVRLPLPVRQPPQRRQHVLARRRDERQGGARRAAPADVLPGAG